MIPPSSKRWCVICREKRTFTYNRTIGHSECIYCGGRFARREGPDEKSIQELKEEYEQIIIDKNKLIDKLKVIIKDKEKAIKQVKYNYQELKQKGYILR